MTDSPTRDAIYFDGALPVGKEEIRLQRLERTRKQLHEYRMLHHEAPPEAASPNLPADYERVLWLQAAMSARRVLPPPLPFMVPAVIEALLKSSFAERVHVVPEEADAACARMARMTGSAILSNDSDMCVYDLSQGNYVVLLQTLEKVSYRQPIAKSRLKISYISPCDVSKRLKVESLLRLSFERSLDGTVSPAVVAERARQALTEANQSVFEAFAADYIVDDQHQADVNLARLDPRTAEFVVQTSLSRPTTSPQVYLPIIHEDPTRDSSWLYGQQLRQLAYSLHSALSKPVTASQSVSEYARKGDRIAMTSIAMLKGSGLGSVAFAVLDDLKSMGPTTPLQWWAYALGAVVRQKLDLNKTVTRANISTLFGLKGSCFKCSWSDVHLHGSIQAVLYSVRMLQQLLQHGRRTNLCSSKAGLPVEELSVAMSGLPSIAELFLSIDELKALTEVQPDAANDLLEKVFTIIREHDPKTADKQGHSPTPAPRDLSDPAEIVQKPRKRIKTTKKAKHSSPQQTNMFRLLADDDETSDED